MGRNLAKKAGDIGIPRFWWLFLCRNEWESFRNEVIFQWKEGITCDHMTWHSASFNHFLLCVRACQEWPVRHQKMFVCLLACMFACCNTLKVLGSPSQLRITLLHVAMCMAMMKAFELYWKRWQPARIFGLFSKWCTSSCGRKGSHHYEIPLPKQITWACACFRKGTPSNIPSDAFKSHTLCKSLQLSAAFTQILADHDPIWPYKIVLTCRWKQLIG